jgi:Flp pilus assembly protein TadD
MLALGGGRALAEDRSVTRAESNQMVSDAEGLVAEAGKRDPVDSALIREAIDKLHEAVKVDPRNDSAYVDLGFCYSVLRDGDTAVEMYMRATQINPSGPNFKELADIYLRVGDPSDALMAAQAGIVKDPRNARLYNAKGMALNDLERFDDAAEAFQKAIDLDPTLAVARANLDALNGSEHGRGTVAKHRKKASPDQQKN